MGAFLLLFRAREAEWTEIGRPMGFWCILGPFRLKSASCGWVIGLDLYSFMQNLGGGINDMCRGRERLGTSRPILTTFNLNFVVVLMK